MSSAAELSKSDAQLSADAAFKEEYAKYTKPVSKEALDKAVKALTEKKHTVKVFESDKEATEYLGSLVKDGMSCSNAASETLSEIGFVDWLKEHDSKITNYKGLAAKAAMAGNMPEHYGYIAKGYSADIFFTSVCAVSQDGDIFFADLSGSRVGGLFSSKQLVIVLGSNKIVADEAEAEKRTQYQYQLESARVRVAYKIPSSQIVNKVAIRSANPFGPRTTVVIVNKPHGY